MGTTVNFASRLQCLAKDDEIIVSKELKNMVQKRFKSLKIATSDRVEEESSKGKIKSFEAEDIVYSIKGKKCRGLPPPKHELEHILLLFSSFLKQNHNHNIELNLIFWSIFGPKGAVGLTGCETSNL